MKPITTHTIVKIHRPQLWLFSLVAIIIAIILLMLLSFDYGRSVAGYDSDGAQAEIERLEQELSMAQVEILETNRQATMLVRNSQIDDDASSQLKDTLAQVQNEALELKKELSFYKSIVAPEQGSRSLTIQTLQIKQEDTGAYHYKLMVTQRGRNDAFARGSINIIINGESEDKPVTLSLAQVTETKQKSMKFGFKYFQNFEGVLNLPESFVPDTVQVKVNPTTGKIKAIDEQYEWSELIAGGA